MRHTDASQTPTSGCWVETSQSHFALAYQSSQLALFDAATAKLLHAFPLLSGQHSGGSQTQPNRVVSHPTFNVVAAAHDHGPITLLDLNSGQVSGKIESAHRSGNSSVLFDPHSGGLHIVSGGHDGAVRVWDIRNYQCIAETPSGVVHQRKFEEGVLCLSVHPDAPFVASGGADCLLNMYEINSSSSV